MGDIWEVSQILDIRDTGVTMPVTCFLSNGEYVLVKYWRNPCGVKVLLNELIGCQVAKEIGLTIPEFGLCNLSEEVIIQTNENEEINVDNAGIGFFTKMLPNSVPISRGILPTVSNVQVERILLYDSIVNNKDRHKGNLLLDLSNGPRVVCIDNSHILVSAQKAGNAELSARIEEAKIISSDMLNVNGDIYDALMECCGFHSVTLKKEAERIRNILTEDVVSLFFDNIPDEWMINGVHEEIDAMKTVLCYRLSYLDRIVNNIMRNRGRG